MLKYIYFPTGRNFWSDLAQDLNKLNFARPIIWVGDRRLDGFAKNVIGDGCVIDFLEIHKSIVNFNIDLSGVEVDFLQSYEGLLLKNKVLKMMDRHDAYGAYRNVDRDNMFKNFVLY